MATLPAKRPPTHPGEMLLEEFLILLGMTQTELAERIKVPYSRINELIHGKRGVTPDTALRLAKLFGTPRVLAKRPTELGSLACDACAKCD